MPELKKFNEVSGEETTVKQHVREKHLRCLSCVEHIQLYEAGNFKHKSIGSKLCNGKPAFIITTVYEGICQQCQREYEIIVRSVY